MTLFTSEAEAEKMRQMLKRLNKPVIKYGSVEIGQLTQMLKKYGKDEVIRALDEIEGNRG